MTYTRFYSIGKYFIFVTNIKDTTLILKNVNSIRHALDYVNEVESVAGQARSLGGWGARSIYENALQSQYVLVAFTFFT